MAVTASELHALIERDPPTVGPRVGHSCSGGTHSRLSDDRVVCWRPDLDGLSTATDRYAIDRYAIDADLADHAGGVQAGAPRPAQSPLLAGFEPPMRLASPRALSMKSGGSASCTVLLAAPAANRRGAPKAWKVR